MLDIIYTDTKSWQGIANCQDQITKSMINYLQTLVVGNNLHSFTCAIIDFTVLACQTGWRGIEWLQPVNPHRSSELSFFEYDNATSKFSNIIYACCVDDSTLKRQCGKIIKDPFSIPIIEAAVCKVRWQFQKKNFQHGQENDFQATTSH